MGRSLWIFVVAWLPTFLDALVLPGSHQSHSLDLLEKKKSVKKKWNWKEASEESKTEWAIVLKRYVLADMTLFELGRYFGEAVEGLTASSEQAAFDSDALEKAHKKLERLRSNLEKAILDQNTSDATAGDMQREDKNNHLTVHEKRILADEHKREQYGFFAVEASGQDVLQQANALFSALEGKQKKKQPQPSWKSIVSAPPPAKNTYAAILPPVHDAHNASGSNTTALNQAHSIQAVFQQFQESSKTFHKDLGNFEAMQQKTITNLLAFATS